MDRGRMEMKGCMHQAERGRCGCHYRELIEGLREVWRDQGTRDKGRERESVGREC